MGVHYYYEVQHNGSRYRNTQRNACFGRLAAHIDKSSRSSSVTLQPDGGYLTPPDAVINKLWNLETDEIVYNLYENWGGGGGIASRVIGGTINADFAMSKVLLRQILSDVNSIKKELPWFDEVATVDIQGISLKVNTNYPADQVFTCLSVVRNLVQMSYGAYKHFIKQGFGKKDAFLLSQHFRFNTDMLGNHTMYLQREGDYMMAHHLHMKMSDIERLFRGEVTWRQGTLKGSKGYIKYLEDTPAGFQEINSSIPLLDVYRRIPQGSAEKIWTAFLSPTIENSEYALSDELQLIYNDRGFSDTNTIEVFNRWVSVINRG